MIKKLTTQSSRQAMKKFIATLVVGCLLFVVGLQPSEAAFNAEINYQGKLMTTGGSAVTDGVYHMRFNLYTVPTGGSPVWSEDRSTALGDRATVSNGLFSLMLGSSTPFTGVDFNQTLYLGVEVGGSGGSPSWDGEMEPRKILGAVPAAFYAESAGSIDGYTSGDFVRTNSTSTIATTSAQTVLTINQTGAGGLLDVKASGVSQLTVGQNGTTFTNATSTNFFSTTASSTNLYTTTFNIGGSAFTSLLGSGLLNTGGALTLDNTGAWTGTFDGQDGTWYIDRANHSGTQLASTISDFSTAVNSYIHSSTTIPKTYTANTFSGLQTLNGGLTIGSLTGPLQAVNGVVSATSTLSTFFGGTGLSTAPTYGQLLLGNASGGYTLTATSSLGITAASTTLLADNNNWSGLNAFGNLTYTNATGTNIFNTTASSTNLFSSLLTVGSNALVVNSSGNVGVGTDDPQAILHLLSADTTLGTQLIIENNVGGDNSGPASLVLQTDEDNDGDLSILFNARMNLNPASIVVNRDGFMDLFADGFTFNGNVSSGELSISADGDEQLTIYNPTADVNMYLRVDDTGLLGIGTGDPNPLSFFNNGGERMRIDENGNVGIGTTSPYAKLSVDGDFALTGRIFDNNASAGTNGMVLQTTGSGIQWVATSTLGISSGSSASSTLLVDNNNFTGTNTFGNITYSNATGTTIFNTTASSTNLFASLLNVGGKALVVNSSGNVGVGTTTLDRAKLTVEINEENPALLLVNSSGNSSELHFESEVGGVIRFLTFADGEVATIRSDGANGSTIGDLLFEAGSNGEAMRIIGTSGNVGIGTDAPISKLTVSDGEAGISLISTLAPADNGIWNIRVNDEGRFSLQTLNDALDADVDVFTIERSGVNPTLASFNTNLSIAGNVGIGTTNPLALLDVRGSVGNELVSNGNFTGGASGWTLGTGWAYGSGAVTHSAGNTASLEQDPLGGGSIVAGKTYRVSIEVTSHTAGEISDVTLGGADAKNGDYSDVDTFVSYVTAVDSSGLIITPFSDYEATIDNISVVEVPSLLAVSDGLGSGLFVDSTGKVGIGNSNLEYMFEIFDDTRQLKFGNIWDEGISTLGLFGNEASSIYFRQQGGGTDWGYLYAGDDHMDLGTYGSRPIIFTTDLSGDGGERMRISDDGKVGIGTTSPYARLSITGTSGQINPLFQVASSTEVPLFTIDPAGKVGIGTSSPRSLLHLEDGEAMIVSYDTGDVMSSSRPAWAFGASGEVFRINSTGSYDDDPSGWDNRLTIDASGDVGIGIEEDPLAKLHIAGGGILLDRFEGDITSDNLQGSIWVKQDGLGDGAYEAMMFRATGYRFVNDSGTADYLTILDGGNVGIGTTSPWKKLSVTGDLALTGGIFDNNSSAGTSGMVLQTTGSGVQWVATSTLGISGGSTASSTLLADNNTWSGTNNFTGNLGIGTSSPYAKLSVAGDVVANYFHATSTVATSTFAGGLVAGGATGLSVLQNGNVGIGTTNPQAKLVVNGTDTWLIEVQNNGSVRWTLGNQGNQEAFHSGTRSFYQHWDSTTIRSDATFSWANSTLVPQGSGDTSLSRLSSGVVAVGTGAQGNAAGTLVAGNIGIGTSEPETPLDIQYGAAKTSTSEANVMMFKSNEVYSSNPQVLEFTSIGATSLEDRVFFLQTSEFNVGYGGNLSLQPYGGSVGIGTTNPTAKLSVSNEVGSELVSNGTFTGNADDWTLDAGWTYGSNKVSSDGTGAASLTQDIGVAADTTYLVSWEILDSVDEEVCVELGGTDIGEFRDDGEYQKVVTTISTDPLIFRNCADFEGSIDNVSVLELTAGVGLYVTNDAIFNKNARVDGNLGIGINGDASAKLHIAGGGILLNRFFGDIDSDNLQGSIWLKGDGLGGGTYEAMMFRATGYRFVNDSGTADYLTILDGGNVGIGTTSPWGKLSVGMDTTSPAFVVGNAGSSTPSLFVGGVNQNGFVGFGTTTVPSLARIVIDQSVSASGSQTAIGGIHQIHTFDPSGNDTVQVGNRLVVQNAPTGNFNTGVGQIIRMIDNSSNKSNLVRGLEVVASGGSNTYGVNTGIRGTGHTFGLQGITTGLAGGTSTPAAIFGENTGTTQGDILRLYTASMTTATSVAQFYHETSTFTGTGLLMNFAKGGGSFTGNFLDLQRNDNTQFKVASTGATVIGQLGQTSVNAGLVIGYGGLCVDNDGSCTASTTGRVTAREFHTAGADLAEAYYSDEKLQPGDIVYTKGSYSIGKAATVTDPIIGVVSTRPGMTLGTGEVSFSLLPEYPVGLTGRVPVKLSTENGPIAVGDKIVLSSVPGVGMKGESNTKRTVIGIALEAFDGSNALSDGTIEVNTQKMLGTKTCVTQQVKGDTKLFGGSDLEGPNAGRTPGTGTETICTQEESEVAPDAGNAQIVKTEEGTKVKIGSALVFLGIERSKLTASNGEVQFAEMFSGNISLENHSIENVKSIASVLGKWSISEDGALVVDSIKARVGTFEENIEVGTNERPSGITIYDSVTGNPYCLGIRNGEMKSTPGKCVAGEVAGASTPTSNNNPEPTPTPTPTPEPEPTPESELAPEPTLEITPEPESAPEPEPPTETASAPPDEGSVGSEESSEGNVGESTT